MNDLAKALILAIITAVALVIDINIRCKTCLQDNNKLCDIITVIIVHRIIYIFMYFGWIFSNKIVLNIYLIFLLCIILHCSSNDWKCYLSQVENSICNFHENNRYDYIFKIFDTKTAVTLTIFFLIFVFSILYWKFFVVK